MIRMWLCLYLPWHKFHTEKKLSDQCSKIRCSCGRHYAINYSVHTFLPWDAEFENYYSNR